MKKKKRISVRRAARGTMDVTSALIRCALACSAFIAVAGALSVTGAYRAMPEWAVLLTQAALTLLCFGLSAAYGLRIADGDQTDRIPRRALTASQLRALAACGVLLVAPMTLLADLLNAPLLRLGLLAPAAPPPPPFALFLPMLVKSAMLAPVCEELFFRGYLQAALKAAGVRGAALIGALFFALVHGVDAAFLPRFLLGLLLFALAQGTDSLLAPMIVHAAYNFTLLMLSFAGLGELFTGLGLFSCLIRVPLCAAFVWALKWAYTARETQQMLRFGRRMTMKQWLLLAVAVYALIACPILLAA